MKTIENKITFNCKQVGDKIFKKGKEIFTLLASNNNIYLYERRDGDGILAYEVVKPVGKNRLYPSSEQFGTFGWCISPKTVFSHPSYIKEKYNINWIYNI